MTDSARYTVPQERGRWRALILAALVHLALLAFLWIGVRWQNETPTTIEAEVWSPQPREAAPVPEPVKPPEPKPVPEPKPEPKPAPKVVAPEPPKPKVEEPPVAKPDIALEQEKKRKLIEEKKRREEDERREERREEERKEKLALEKKRHDEELAKEKKRRDEDLAKEQKREQEEKEKLAKAKAEEAKRLEKEKAAKAEAEKKLAEKKRQEDAEAKLAQKIREENMRRITGAGGSGDAPKAQGGRADGAYSQRIAAKIRSNISFIVPEGLQGNPPVEYEVRLLPDGSVAGMRKLRSSGVPGFDEAVARAIERAQPYPKDSSGSVPSTFIGNHKPKDQ